MKYLKFILLVLQSVALVQTMPQQEPAVPKKAAGQSNTLSLKDQMSKSKGLNGEHVTTASTARKTGGKPIGEYNPIEGLIIAQSYCDPGVSRYLELNEIHAKIIKSATEQSVKVFFKVREGEEENCRNRVGEHLPNKFTPENYPMVTFLHVDPNSDRDRYPTFFPSIWTRDYTPQWLRRKNLKGVNQDGIAIVPLAWGETYAERSLVYDYTQANLDKFKKTSLSGTNLINEGGNFVANDAGLCISSAAVLVKNGMGEEEMKRFYADFYGCNESIFIEMVPFDSVRHSDMFVSFARQNVILVGVYNSTDVDEATATVSKNNFKLISKNKFVQEKKYEVVRVPMPTYCPTGDTDCVSLLSTCKLKKTEEDPEDCTMTSLSKCSPGTIDDISFCTRVFIGENLPTYLNHFHLNGHLHVPIYNRNKKYEKKALQIIMDKTKKKKIIKHVADDLVSFGGAIHCIVKEIPRGTLFKQP